MQPPGSARQSEQYATGCSHGSSAKGPVSPRHGLGQGVRVPVRVHLSSDQRALAEVLCVRLDLEPRLAVVGVGTGEQAVSGSWDVSDADVVVADFDRDRHMGQDPCQRVVENCPGAAVIVLLEAAEPEYLIAALRAGVAGAVSKTAGAEELIHAIHAVARGEMWISSAMLAGVLRCLLRPTDAGWASRLTGLTSRELDVLSYLMVGMNRAGIARHLVVSTHTVRTHTHNLLSKLSATSTLEAVAMAREAGLAPFAGEVR